MQVVTQRVEEILESLRPLVVEWKDDTALRVIAEIEAMPVKSAYTVADVAALLDKHFEDAQLILRLFLGLSKDDFGSVLRSALKSGSIGKTRYLKNPSEYLDALVELGILEAMAEQTNRVPKWNDILIERLRSGRGSAISGQRRGRSVEDFVESIVRKVFNNSFSARVTFEGARGARAKCDFAIPDRLNPRILIEAKGYGATGSKMTDVIGDIEKIIAAKRTDTAFLFFTDGLTWKQRQSDLRRIVEYQNDGFIARIYTYAMADQFEEDLRQLKTEYRIEST